MPWPSWLKIKIRVAWSLTFFHSSSLVIFTRPRAPMTLGVSGLPSETIYLRLELEHMCQDSCPVKTQFEPQTHETRTCPAKTHSLSTEAANLVLAPDEVLVLNGSWKKEFNERQSDRSEVNLFREKHSTDRVSTISRQEQPWEKQTAEARMWAIAEGESNLKMCCG